MTDLDRIAQKLLDTIAGVHVGLQVEPGKVIKSSDVIAVCKAYLGARPERERVREVLRAELSELAFNGIAAQLGWEVEP